MRTQDTNTLREMMDKAPVAIQVVGPEGTFIDCNQKTVEMFGYGSPDQVIGQPPGILSPRVQSSGHNSGEASMEMIKQAFTGKTVVFAWEHLKATGEIFPAEVTLDLIQYEGQPSLMASVIDLTGQVRQKNAMSALIRDAPFPILTVAPDLSITSYNQAYLAVTGYTKEQADHQRLEDHQVLEQDGKSIREAFQTGKTLQGKMICRFASGIRHIDYSYVPVVDHLGEILQVYYIMVDQTGLVNKLTESETLITHSPASILIVDLSGKVLSSNPAFAAISHLTPEALSSLNIKEFSILSRSGGSLQEAIQSKKPSTGKLTVDFGYDQKILEYCYIPLPDTDGAITRIIAQYIDVTPVHRLVDYLDQSVKVLEEHIGDLARGETNFSPAVLPADEYTRSAEQQFVSINKSLEVTRSAIERLVHDSIAFSEAASIGNLAFRADPGNHTGEYRRIIEGLNQTLDSIVIPLREAMRVSHEYAGYSFDARFSREYAVKGDWIAFRDALDTIGVEVSSIIRQITGKLDDLMKNTEDANASIEEITSSTTEITSSMQVVSSDLKNGDNSIVQILNAMNDLITVVSAVSSKADSVASLSHDANNFAKNGITLAEASEQSMTDIKKSSEQVGSIIAGINDEMNQIGMIVKLITDIANQTNLLALNAAIEAARAGEAGRGFAVVASEVKSLAQDSKNSAEKISDLITALKTRAESATVAMSQSNQVVQEGSASLGETLNAFTKIAGAIEEINHHITEVASATEEQAASVEEITASMQEVSDITHHITEETGSVASASQETSSAMSKINQVVADVAVSVGEISQQVAHIRT